MSNAAAGIYKKFIVQFPLGGCHCVEAAFVEESEGELRFFDEHGVHIHLFYGGRLFVEAAALSAAREEWERELRELEAWTLDSQRKSPELTFTSGPIRRLADIILTALTRKESE